MTDDSGFSGEQKRYLEGHMSGLTVGRAVQSPTSNRAGGKLSDPEKFKRELNPLDGDEKVYVQGRMREVGRDLWVWLAGGAHICVCGDAQRMAKDVELALVDIVAQRGVRTQEQAVTLVTELKKQGRYQQDVY